MIGLDSKELKNIEPFQVFSLLDENDFSRILEEKKKYISQTYSDNKTIIRNKNYSFEKIGTFSKICDKVKNSLVDKGFANPTLTRVQILNHYKRNYMGFHKHRLQEFIDPYSQNNPFLQTKAESIYSTPFEYFWIAIYYTHNLYDKEYAGELTVRLEENDKGITFPCTPNSLILHNGLYGHEVNIPKLHPTIIRDACFTHWICDHNT